MVIPFLIYINYISILIKILGLIMEFTKWQNNLEEAFKKIEESLKIQQEKMKEMPCHEYLKFDKSFNLISKEQYCNVMKVLLTLFSLDYNKDSFVFYDQKNKEWKTIINRDKIDKQKLSEICYEIHYDDKQTVLSCNKQLYIIITRQIKEYYKSEFDLKPIFMPFEMNITNIPTISNFNPSHSMVSSKYGMVNLNYKPDETLKFNITEDYEGNKEK